MELREKQKSVAKAVKIGSHHYATIDGVLQRPRFDTHTQALSFGVGVVNGTRKPEPLNGHKDRRPR